MSKGKNEIQDPTTVICFKWNKRVILLQIVVWFKFVILENYENTKLMKKQFHFVYCLSENFQFFVLFCFISKYRDNNFK